MDIRRSQECAVDRRSARERETGGSWGPAAADSRAAGSDAAESESTGRHEPAKNRIEQLCQSGNIKISLAATDLFGVSGRKILKALVEGKRDAGWMAHYA